MIPAQRIAINGMGRIGRTLLRLFAQRGELNRVVAINDIMPKENLIYLLRYDSIRGPLNLSLEPTSKGLTINGHEIFYFTEANPATLPWREHYVQTVIEATGLFTAKAEAMAHLRSGAQTVLLTTFSKDVPLTVWGVNHTNRAAAEVISPGDCTLNCVAPIVNQLQTRWEIESLHINVIQGYTTRQELIDGPHKAMRRGRAAAHSIIPFEVHIAGPLESLFGNLADKIRSMSTRVPVACGALAELSITLTQDAESDDIHAVLKNLPGIIAVTNDPIVSSDILGDTHSATIDGLLTEVTQNRHLRLMAWFDNEWGFASRLADWLHLPKN